MEARRETVELARELRSGASLPEGLLWQQLRSRKLEGMKFRRQHPMGPYILDFFCPAARLVVEVDGQSHGDPERIRKDAIRDSWLERQGLMVVRLPARTVLYDMDSAIRTVLDAVGTRPR